MSLSHASADPLRSPSDVALTWLARLGAGVGSVMVLLTCVLWLRNGAIVDLNDTLGTLGDLLMALACCVVAGLILGHRPRHRIGWLLLTIGLLWATEWFGEAYGRYAYITLDQELTGATFLLWLSSLTWVPGFGLVIWLILLFPDGRPLSSRWLWVGWAATVLTLPTTLLVGFFEWPLTGPQLWAFLYSEQMSALDAEQQRLQTLLAGPIGLSVPLAFLLLLPATVALFLRLRRAQGVERQQVKWFAYAVLLLTLTMTFLVLIQLWETQTDAELPALSVLWELLYVVAPAFLPVAIGIAILRHRLWDIDLIIRRTLVYTLLTSLVIGVYVAIVAGVGALLASGPVAAAQPGASSPWPALPLQLVAAGAVAVLFQPARHWLQQRVNRLFYGEVDDPYAVVTRLGQQLENSLAPQTVLSTIVETVRTALKLPYVELRLDNGERPITSNGLPPAVIPLPEQLTILPLVHQGEHVGELLLAPRLGDDDFSSADRHLLQGLARQAGAAVQAVRLTADLQQSRQRLVTAREEERRRLRRDLHDGLGAALASIAMQTDAARTLVDEAPEASKEMLSELTVQVQETIADVRRLIYNLRPPALDDLGLLAALQQLVLAHSAPARQITLEAPPGLPALPAAVEAAAYRIVQEALTNVVRHAEARHGVVQVAYVAPTESSALMDATAAALLTVEICDDGIGLPVQRQAGVGTSSMRERAEELGGTLTIAVRPEGGTCVTARLPLA